MEILLDMDTWLTALLSSIMSGCVVGLLLTVAKNKIDLTSRKVEKANELELSNVKEHIDELKKEIGMLKNKQDKIGEGVIAINMKVSNNSIELKFVQEKVNEMSSQVRSLHENFGKVIRR